ncbi:MAG: chemotaxis-specific protein-glutamate methyltransferase CheB [Gammaproteobacteria bacterium]|nr:chemotaxis-specific protein-glutamate methyltransferase CheB [Gammaproteobacteria bacterium]
MLKVLIAEDTQVVAQVIRYVLEQVGDIEIVGIAENGAQAVELVRTCQPDIVTMDIHMPVLNGLDAIRQIMAECPVPIVVVSATVNAAQQYDSFEAIESGALALLPKPPSIDSAAFVEYCALLVNTVRAMAEIKVVRRKRESMPRVTAPLNKMSSALVTRKLVLLGASTGGPHAVREILQGLPANYPCPVVIVQHITSGFLDGLIAWLRSKCALKIKVASNGEVLQAGSVYFAPDNVHLELDAVGDQIVARYSDAAPVNGFRPSIDRLFGSIEPGLARGVVAAVLTGMGGDGARGLLALKSSGALTLAQDEQSSVVYGMPAVAVQIGAAMQVLSLEGIAAVLADR